MEAHSGALFLHRATVLFVDILIFGVENLALVFLSIIGIEGLLLITFQVLPATF